MSGETTAELPKQKVRIVATYVPCEARGGPQTASHWKLEVINLEAGGGLLLERKHYGLHLETGVDELKADWPGWDVMSVTKTNDPFAQE